MFFTIPNLISYFRIVLCLFAFYNFYQNHNQWQFFYLTIAVILSDALDGFIARTFKMESDFGAKLDIWADRFVELAYWLFFALIGLCSYWFFALFLIRGLVVDFISRKNSKPLGDSWLRSSRFMRGFYGFLKLTSFVVLILIPNSIYSFWVLVLTLVVCYLRAIPVIWQNQDNM